MKKNQPWVLIFILFSSLSLFGQQMFQHLLGLNSFPDYTWTGAGPDTNWTTATNWNGNIVPGSIHTAHFICAACTTHCLATINASISVAGIDIQTTYNSTITQAPGFTVTVGTSGFSQSGGTFAGGNSDILINSDFILNGGTFNSTTARLQLGHGSTVTGSVAMVAPGLYSHNNGTVELGGGGSGGLVATLNMNGATFYNLSLKDRTSAGVSFNFPGT
ncbi:MAG: hypothetical protein H7235_00650, partial [Bdellovibrionaceae bacterium]|nr:hypothetical protein [Pseudobdellovibrionaceae bacterium]